VLLEEWEQIKMSIRRVYEDKKPQITMEDNLWDTSGRKQDWG